MEVETTKFDEVLAPFLNAMADIELRSRLSGRIFENERQTVLDGDRVFRGNTFYFPNPILNNCQYIQYGEEISQDKGKIIQQIDSSENRQLQFLLVEAYESFLGFCQDFYATMGFKFPGSWRAKDFGDMSIDEAHSQEHLFFRNKTKELKHSQIYTIPIQQAKRHTNLSDLLKQRSNKLPSLEVSLFIIEKFRHFIVHNNGLISRFEKSKLTDGVTNKIQSNSEQAEYKQDLEKNRLGLYIEDYDRENLYLNFLPISKGGDLGGHTNIWKHLIDELISMAYLMNYALRQKSQSEPSDVIDDGY